MKKRGKKLLSLLLGTAMAISVLAGCGSSSAADTSAADGTVEEESTVTEAADTETTETAAIDTSEHVELTMYLLGDRTPDFDEVYGKINEIL